jgi:hypothetical protein
MENKREYVYVVSIIEETYSGLGEMCGNYTPSKITRMPNIDSFTFKTEALARDFMNSKIAERLTWGDITKITAVHNGHDGTHLWNEFTDMYVFNQNGEMYIRIEIRNVWVHSETF